MNYPGDGISEFFNRVNKQGLWFEIQQNSCFEISEKILNLPVNVGRLVKKLELWSKIGYFALTLN